MPGPKDGQFAGFAAAVERLQIAFTMERKVYLFGVIVGILLLAFYSVMSAFGMINRDNWMFAFAPGGVYLGMLTAAMVNYKKSLEIVDRIAEGEASGR